MRRLNRKGFTLVEIMIVVAIIGLLAAIAIPNFISARDTAISNTCAANVRTLQSALEMYWFDTGIGVKAMTTAQLSAATGLVPAYVRAWPTCGGGGAYSVPLADGIVDCSVH